MTARSLLAARLLQYGDITTTIVKVMAARIRKLGKSYKIKIELTKTTSLVLSITLFP